MMDVPAVTIHSLAHARTAVRIAGELGQTIILLSPPGAAAYVGPAWFKEVVAAARQDQPEADVSALLDCGDRPGDVAL